MTRIKETQLSILSLKPPTHDITTEPVPECLSLRPGLVKILIAKTQGEEITRFCLPAQWKPASAAVLIYEIRGTVWQLGKTAYPFTTKKLVKESAQVL